MYFEVGILVEWHLAESAMIYVKQCQYDYGYKKETIEYNFIHSFIHSSTSL